MTTSINWSPGFCCQPPTVHSLLSSQKDPMKTYPKSCPYSSPNCYSSHLTQRQSYSPRSCQEGSGPHYHAGLSLWGFLLPPVQPHRPHYCSLNTPGVIPSSGLVVPSAWKVLLRGNHVAPALTTLRSLGKCPLRSVPCTLHLKLHPTPYRLSPLLCFIKW